jgi:hypothetical protein
LKRVLKLFLPTFILKAMVKIKYRQKNIICHTYNINSNKFVTIICTNQQKYSFLKTILKESFAGVLRVVNKKVYFYPIAIIKIPVKIDQYLKEIGPKSRNMIKKAEKNSINCEVFNWNEKLEEIYVINRSSEKRQGREMDDSYQEYPKEITYSNEDDFKIVYIGSFLEKKLIGYIELYIYGNFAMINRILGHKEYLKLGIMNLMIKSCVEYSISNDISYINYLTMQNRENNSLSAFKYRVGFRKYSLEELK